MTLERLNAFLHMIFLEHFLQMQKKQFVVKKKTIAQRNRQCHYCSNYFVKSFEKMQKHLSVCTGKAGYEFTFDNGKIIDY